MRAWFILFAVLIIALLGLVGCLFKASIGGKVLALITLLFWLYVACGSLSTFLFISNKAAVEGISFAAADTRQAEIEAQEHFEKILDRLFDR